MTRLVDGKWQSAFVRGLILQIALLILIALVLDGGCYFRVYCLCLIVQLVLTGLLIWCRPRKPTTAGIAFVKYGIIPITVFGFSVANILG